MTESTGQTAPSLGTPTDSPVGADAAQKTAGEPMSSTVDEPAEADKTMDTPDELGGTGGEQAGGAG
ncbi:MAG TPA: hypothetical protein VFJ17_08840 [Mycobacteriales bacterium]|nr:hypothetical protein [Mycobacteriales bacterium]